MADNPASVVTSFIVAMNGWELQADAERRAAKAAGEERSGGYAMDTLKAVFRLHCTPRACGRPQGRVAAPFFQRPPEYDPANERVVAVSSSGKRIAAVETERTSVLGGGRYRYALHQVEDRWLIDSVKYLQEDKWVPQTL